MKTRLLFAILISFALLSAGTAFAATQSIVGPANGTIGATVKGTVPVSKNVTLTYVGAGGGVVTPSYAASTGHTSGTKTFGTSNLATVLYYIVEVPNTSKVTSTSIDFDSWTAQ